MSNRKINIGYDAKRFFFNQSGLGNYSRYIINGMKNLYPEFGVTLFSPKFIPNNRLVVSPNKLTLFGFIWRTITMVKSPQFKALDIYHGLSNELPLARTKAKKVVTIHDVIFKRLPQTQSVINRFIYDFKTKKACKNADKIVAISEQTKQDLIDFYGVHPSKIEVVYQDCLPQFYEKGNQTKNIRSKYGLPLPYILCTGTIEYRKSQLDLVKAFEQLDFEGDLVLLGKKTRYYRQIETYLSTKPQLAKRVKVLNKTDFSDFPSIYAEAKVFVYPSIYEGFGIPILEALNTKVPTVTTKGTVMEEVGGDAVLYFEPKNTADLTTKITCLLNDDHLRQKLIKKGESQVLKFRKEVTLSKMASLYHSIL